MVVHISLFIFSFFFLFFRSLFKLSQSELPDPKSDLGVGNTHLKLLLIHSSQWYPRSKQTRDLKHRVQMSNSHTREESTQEQILNRSQFHILCEFYTLDLTIYRLTPGLNIFHFHTIQFFSLFHTDNLCFAQQSCNFWRQRSWRHAVQVPIYSFSDIYVALLRHHVQPIRNWRE